MKRLSRIVFALTATLLTATLPAAAQTSAEKMRAKVDSLREAARRQEHASLKTIDPKMDAMMDSLLAIPVDSSLFKGKSISIDAINIDDLRRQARLYVGEYDFEEALNSLEQARSMCRDSSLMQAIDAEMVRCSNALKMMEYCTRPKVVARQKFPLKDFFLYYPMQDYSWRPCPNQLDREGGAFARSLFFPDFSHEVIFSAPGRNGDRDIQVSRRRNGMWTRPEALDSTLVSGEDEIFPVVCGDVLYFASKGLYGMGGYDIYSSRRDPETGRWGTPENLGFPFNSPYDDFMFINTADGKYSLFASNRECSADSVFIYVLEYDSMPVRSSVSGASDLYRLCALRPSYDLKKIDNSYAMSLGVADEKTMRYMDKVAEVRSIRDTLAMRNRELDELRGRYTAASDWQRVNIGTEISRQEGELLKMQKKLEAAGKELQQIEMEFLMGGVVLDARKAVAEADKDIVGADKSYTFTRKSPGEPFYVELEPVPVPNLPELEVPEIEDL